MKRLLFLISWNLWIKHRIFFTLEFKYFPSAVKKKKGQTDNINNNNIKAVFNSAAGSDWSATGSSYCPNPTGTRFSNHVLNHRYTRVCVCVCELRPSHTHTHTHILPTSQLTIYSLNLILTYVGKGWRKNKEFSLFSAANLIYPFNLISISSDCE